MSLIRANALAIPLRDQCVQCVVTSPPYWGLRDYGTSKWEGGDPDCDHRKVAAGTAALAKSTLGPNRDGVSGQATNGHQQEGFKGDCKRCGAKRIDDQIGLEPTPDAYVAQIVAVFAEVRRVLKADGVAWLNLGDSYCGYWGDAKALAEGRPSSADTNGWTNGFNMNARPKYDALRATGIKPKDLVGIPWRVAFALQAAGWYLRSDIIWSKPNPMPESVTDRPTKAHEYIFLLTKSPRYYYDTDAIREPHKPESLARYEYGLNVSAPADGFVNAGAANLRAIGHCERMGDNINAIGRNKRSVWHVATQPYADAHFATFPEALVEPCILAGSRVGDLCFDPFIGSGTVGKVCDRLMRRWVGTDLTYQHLAKARTAQMGLRVVNE